nr:hypothetical protein [Tanacetum cinerariifolium]
MHQPPQEMSIQEMEDLKQHMSIEINKKEKLQQLEQVANLSTYPSKRFNSFCYDDDDDKDYTAVITPDFPITDSLIMENEHLDTIPETESDEFIKSSVENLVQIPKSLLNRDTLMASSPKFDSLLEEFFGELAHTDLIPLGINEANCDPAEDIHLVERLLYDSDSERDTLSLERLLHDDPIPLPDIFDFSNVFRVFLPFFTYPVTSSILLSSRSEDTIFDPGISDYHFSSFMTGVSHRSGTFKKFIVYPNHLNETKERIKILQLKKRVKKLEKKKRSKSSGFKRLRREGKIEAIDADEDITMVKYQSLKKKPVSVAQARENMIIYLKNMAGYKIEHFRGMTYDKVMRIFKRKYKKVQTLFKPDKDVKEPKKKRVADETLLQESFKKVRAVEVSGFESTQEIPSNDLKEMSEEDVQNMLEIILVSEFKVKALQVKGNDIFMLIEKDYPLSNSVMILMLSGRLQVEEDNEVARDLVMKIFMEANKPKSKSLDTSSK